MILKNSLITMLNTMMSLLIGIFVSSVLVVRTLGPENYGWYSYAMSIVAIATSISSLGVNTIAVKFANRHSAKANIYYRYAHTLKLIAGFLSAIVIVIFAYTRVEISSSQRNVLLFLSFVPMASSWGIYRTRLTTELHAFDNTKNSIIVLVLGTLFRLSIVYFHLHWYLFALCVLTDRVAIAILTELSNARRHGLCISHWSFNTLSRSKFLKESGPLFIAGVLNILYLRIDQVMLYELATPAILANYSIAVKWTESWYFIPAALVASVMGMLFSTLDTDIHENRFRRLLNLVGAISLGFVVFFLLFAGVLITRLYGNDFTGAIEPLRILAFAGVVATLGSVWSTYVISLGLQKLLLLLVAFSSSGNIILNIILIPRYGASGAALATILANVFPLFIIGLWNKTLRASTILMIRAATGIPGAQEIVALFKKYKNNRK